MVDRTKLAELFAVADHGVVSSINAEGKSQSALVGVTFLPDQFQILIGTSDESRKYRNISANGDISLVLWHDKVTAQIEAAARVVEHNSPEYDEISQAALEIDPSKSKHFANPHRVWIVLTPKWLRYTDISSFPWEIEEETVSSK